MASNIQSGSDAVNLATKWIGTPYQWGGGHGGPVPIGTPVDCSGLVNQVFGVTGTTFTQVKMGAPVNNIGSAGPGDLVFFGPLAPGEPHHVGIYTGSGMMIDAPRTGVPVGRHAVSGYGPIYAIRRLVTTAAGTGDAGGTNATVQFNYAQLEGVWVLAGGNAQNAAMAAAISMAESGGRSDASNTNRNGSIDRGLWQINSSNGAGSSFDIMTNARTAVSMSGSGTNWRPWCTAYSDGACGTNGGTYLGSGSPYQKYLQQGVPPDLTVPLNGTAAVTPGAGTSQNADLTSFGIDCSSFPGNLDPLCIVSAAGGDLAAKVIAAIIKKILSPLIQLVAGVMGTVAGGTIMIIGIFMMIAASREGRKVIGAGVGLGATALGQPELGAAAATGSVSGGARQFIGGARSQARFTQRSGVIQQRGQALLQGRVEAGRQMDISRAQRDAAIQQARTAEFRARQAIQTDEALRRTANTYKVRRPSGGPGPNRPVRDPNQGRLFR